MIHSEVGEKIENETMETRVSLHPFFVGMERTQLALLIECAIPVHFKKGQIIFHAGDIANRFYLLETGSVVLESPRKGGESMIVDTIGAGDLLGWSWMFPPYAWQFTARAVEETDAIFFYGTILREYCERDSSLGFELIKRMSVTMNRRLQAARNQMLRVQARQETLQSAAKEKVDRDDSGEERSRDGAG